MTGPKIGSFLVQTSWQSQQNLQPTIIARVMQSPLVMQNEFSPPQNILHCLFLLDLKYILPLAYNVIFYTKKNDQHDTDAGGIKYINNSLTWILKISTEL